MRQLRAKRRHSGHSLEVIDCLFSAHADTPDALKDRGELFADSGSTFVIEQKNVDRYLGLFSPYCVEAPHPGAREDQVKGNEAIKDFERATVYYRHETARRSIGKIPIGDRHLSRHNEGRRAREQTNRNQRATDDLDQPANTEHRK